MAQSDSKARATTSGSSLSGIAASLFKVSDDKQGSSTWNRKGDKDGLINICQEDINGQHDVLICKDVSAHILFECAPALRNYLVGNNILVPTGCIDDDTVHSVVTTILHRAKTGESVNMKMEETFINLIKWHIVLVFFEMRKEAGWLLDFLWTFFDQNELTQNDVEYIWHLYTAYEECEPWPAGPYSPPYAMFYVQMMAWQFIKLQVQEKPKDELFGFAKAESDWPLLKNIVEERYVRYGAASGYEPTEAEKTQQPATVTMRDFLGHFSGLKPHTESKKRSESSAKDNTKPSALYMRWAHVGEFQGDPVELLGLKEAGAGAPSAIAPASTKTLTESSLAVQPSSPRETLQPGTTKQQPPRIDAQASTDRPSLGPFHTDWYYGKGEWTEDTSYTPPGVGFFSARKEDHYGPTSSTSSGTSAPPSFQSTVFSSTPLMTTSFISNATSLASQPMPSGGAPQPTTPGFFNNPAFQAPTSTPSFASTPPHSFGSIGSTVANTPDNSFNASDATSAALNANSSPFGTPFGNPGSDPAAAQQMFGAPSATAGGARRFAKPTGTKGTRNSGR